MQVIKLFLIMILVFCSTAFSWYDEIAKGTVDYSTYVKMIDDDDASAKTGLTYTDFTLGYARFQTASAGALTEVTGGTATGHTDYSVFEVDSTNMPGVYKIDWADAAFATGVDSVELSITATDCLGVLQTIKLRETYPEVDVQQWDGGDVPAPAQTGVPKTDLTYIEGVGAESTSGELHTLDDSGNSIAPASTALSNATWTDARAGYIDAIDTGVNNIEAKLPSKSYLAGTDQANGDIDNIHSDAVDDFWAKVMADLAVPPPYNCSAHVALNWIFALSRNKTETTNSEISIYKDDGTTKLAESDISDDNTTFTRGEYGAPD